MALKKVKRPTASKVEEKEKLHDLKQESYQAKQSPINIIQPEAIEKYVNLLDELVFFNWLKNNICNIENTLLKACLSNLFSLDEIGHKYYKKIVCGTNYSQYTHERLIKEVESGLVNGTVIPASYDYLEALGFPKDPLDVGSPENEIKVEIERLRMEERGIKCNNNKYYSINPNEFSEYFFERVTIVNYNGGYYAYDTSGYYRKTDIFDIKRAAKKIVHEAKKNIWSAKMERDIWASINLEILRVECLDNFTNYINFNNGMYNLVERKLLIHHPKYLSTIRIPHDYHPDAKCPMFRTFLSDLMEGDKERIQLLEEIMGYCLTMLTCIQKGIFFYGTGGNGKSKFAEVLTYICGSENVSNIPLEVLGSRFGTENLPGKIMNVSAENEFKGKMDTSNFKAITGGDPLHVDAKFKKAETFRVVVKSIALLNKLPDVDDVSEGYFRRVLIVPFNKKFDQNNGDKNILEKILNETEGIIASAIEGFHRLYDQDYNYSESQVCNDTFEKYKRMQNPISEYFDDMIALGVEQQVKQSDIMKSFKKWAKDNGITDWCSISSTKFWCLFNKILIDKGIVLRHKKIKGTTYLEGINIK